MYETQLAKLKKLMAAADYRAAVKLCAGWGKRGLGNGAHAAAILGAWEAYARPEWQLALGKDPEAMIAAGIAAICERYEIPAPAESNA